MADLSALENAGVDGYMQTSSSLSSLYPGDVGIETDPNVVFVENFEESTLANLFSRWTDVLNGTAMSFNPDVPAGSTGIRSLNIPWVGGGVNNGGHLYKQLTAGIDDTLYLRYYIKYPTSGKHSHDGIWMGGANPPLAWPNPQAGIKPSGSDRFSAAAEQNWNATTFDHYDYWMNMHQSLDGNYWGNLLLNNPSVKGKTGQWMCVEHMVRLNNPVTSFNGEHAIWLDGVKVSHLGLGFPTGSWTGGMFTQSLTGTPFEGFRWRSDANLKLNWIWLQTYAPNDPAGFSASMKFDHVVAAKTYIGCLGSTASSGPRPPTNVRVVRDSSFAPVAQVTVTPATWSLTTGATKQFTATLKDVNGTVLTGRVVTWSSSNPAVATVSGSGLVTALIAGAATITATSEGQSGSAAVSVSTLPATSWPNEPAGFTVLSDQPWDLLTGLGWNYLRRTASKDASIVTDSTAPFSPLNVLRMVFTTDMARDSEPSVHWMSLSSRPSELYTGWWMKVSPNWKCSPAGCGKVTFVWAPDGAGQVYTNIYHQSDTVQGPPFRVGTNTEWAPYGQKIWMPNVTTTLVNAGEWYRIEFYYKWASSTTAPDGVIRWWVNGVLNGDYRDVRYPTCCAQQFEFAPTLQNPPPAEQYMYIDHVRVSRR